jgi:hypothetical protein
MARSYQPTEYGSLYQGSAKERQFTQIQPFDQSNQIKQRSEEKINNIKNLAKGNQIQANLDRATVQGNQQITKAQFDGKWKAINGLISLTKTGIELYTTIKEDREEKQKENALFESIGGGDYVPETVEESKETNNNQDIEINSESAAINETSGELIEEGGIENLDLSNQLQESSTSNLITNLKGDVFGAVGLHQTYLRERLANIDPDEMPKGLAGIRVLLKSFNREFLKSGGLLDPRLKDLVVDNLAETMVTNTNYIAAELNQNNIKATQKANRLVADNYIAKLVDNTKLTLQEKWTKASDAFFGNNVGFINRTLANEAALKQLLEEIALSGPEAVPVINKLRNVLQNGKTGTELNKTYKSLFDEYEIKARDNNIQEFQRAANERAIANKKVVNNYYKNPTPENKLKAVNSLMAIGTKESIAEAIALNQTGLGYDPKKAAELLLEMSKGAEYDEEDFKPLLDEGIISESQYEILKKSGPLRRSKVELKEYLETIDGDLLNAITKGYDEADLEKGNLLSSLGNKKEGLKEEVYERLLAEIRINPNLLNDKNSLAETTIKIVDQLMDSGKYTATKTAGKGWQFTYDSNTAQTNLKSINIIDKPGSQDYSKFNYDQLFNKKKLSIAEMSATDDYFFTETEIKQEFEYFETNGIPSQKLLNYSKALGYTPKAFLNEQIRLFEDLPDFNKNYVRDFKNNIPKIIGDTSGGFKYLIREGGLSNKGSAYLAAAIEKFSGWNFNEEDKGLKTCVPFMDHPMRVAALEKKFGKKINQITAKEQLSYMIQEMKTDYKEVYRILTDPFSSDDDIKSALVNYCGVINPSTLETTVKSLLAP